MSCVVSSFSLTAWHHVSGDSDGLCGNPKSIEGWDDLLREDVGVITPNPKTSGGARWNYLAAWYYFESQGQSEEEITENMKTLYHNVLVLDSGARGATTTFAENGQGDVLIA